MTSEVTVETENARLLTRILLIVLVAVVLFTGGGCSDQSSEPGNTAKTGQAGLLCPKGDPVEVDGTRKLALIVGINKYAASSIPSLGGAVGDATRFYELLTNPRGYAFPKENVCLLTDEQATVANVQRLFQQLLVDRVRDSDLAVFYYAGHGSQTKDRNGDEPDGKDETFVLHDSRSKGIRDLSDDRFNAMLQSLHDKTSHIAVFIDSCNSGSATRGEGARFVPPARQVSTVDIEEPEQGDSAGEWVPENLPGMVVFTAASDGTFAKERNGRGVFTDAVLSVFSDSGGEILTYAQAARRIPPLVSAWSYQIPYFQGPLDSPVFSTTKPLKANVWEVVSVGETISLSGPPLPGLSKGAEMRVFPGATVQEDLEMPEESRGILVIDRMSGLNATGHMLSQRPGAAVVEPGDKAVLLRPGQDSLRIGLRIALPGERKQHIRQLLEADPDVAQLVQFEASAADFVLTQTTDGELRLLGPEGRVRNVFKEESLLPRILWQHARQRALLQLKGEGGKRYTDDETLEVQLVPAKKQGSCVRGTWKQAAPNEEQVIPLCYRWHVKVHLREDAPTGLLVGGVILSTDGSLFGFPSDGHNQLLRPGETHVFKGETFMGTPPVDVQDRLIVFGTQESNPVPWFKLTSKSASRAAVFSSSLGRTLNRYFQAGSRGQQLVTEEAEETSWTLSSIAMRVEANTGFLKPKGESAPVSSREYTIKSFDIRPYLPDDKNTALYKVLKKADWLANASAEDGFSYKQHDWSLGSDEENLARGIDCSRAIWFAFTRAGLPYNANDRYLSTAMMVEADSPMRDRFDRCDAMDLRIGDILVYRDETRGDGHVVMVIDPRKRIAWGSHGWDGNAGNLKLEPDTGVEYQLIKYKKDWQRWDRPTMELKACWRYRQFARELEQGRGLPGVQSLSDVCNAQRNCGL
ncbi:caspase family protein [Thiolapillus sp.]